MTRQRKLPLEWRASSTAIRSSEGRLATRIMMSASFASGNALKLRIVTGSSEPTPLSSPNVKTPIRVFYQRSHPSMPGPPRKLATPHLLRVLEAHHRSSSGFNRKKSRWLIEKPCALFFGLRNNAGKSISVRSVGRMLRRLMKARKLQPMHPHLLRHACATDLRKTAALWM